MDITIKPNDYDDVELVRLFGQSVVIGDDLETPKPHFHKTGATHIAELVVTLPVAHAAKFAIPCDECFPVES